jgi:hypothetical protein
MIPIKVQCGCGQKYAFDIEPVNGRMPQPVKCPVCGADGMAAANEIIARTLAAQTPPPLPASPPTASHTPSPVVPIASNLPDEKAKKSKIALWIGASAGCVLLAAAVAGFIWWNQSPKMEAIPPDYRFKNQNVTLPTEVASFISAKEQQAKAFAQQQNSELEPAIKKYFAAVKAGHVGKAQQLYWGMQSTNVTGQPIFPK